MSSLATTPSMRPFPFSTKMGVPVNPAKFGPDIRQLPFAADPGSKHTFANIKCNQFISTNIIVNPWGEPYNWEKLLHEEQYMFVCRGSAKFPGHESFTVVNLWQMNAILDDSFNSFQELLDEASSNGKGIAPGNNPSSDAILQIMSRPSHMWEDLGLYRNVHISKLSKCGILKNLSEEGIFSNWNKFGVMLNTQEASSYQGVPVDVNEFLVLAVVTDGSVRMSNYWGSKAAKGASLWLILKRRAHNDGGKVVYSSFFFKPWVSPVGGKPSQSDRQYEDFSGNTCYGTSIYIGQVTDNEAVNIDDSLSRDASGEIGDVRSNHNASATVQYIGVTLGSAYHGMKVIP